MVEAGLVQIYLSRVMLGQVRSGQMYLSRVKPTEILEVSDKDSSRPSAFVVRWAD